MEPTLATEPIGGLSDTERNMLAAGEQIDEAAFEDYFGFDETKRWYFPDGVRYIEYKLMNDGARGRYQAATTVDVRLFKTSGDAQIKPDPLKERTILFEESVVGWHMLRRNASGVLEAVPFDKDGKPKAGGPFDQWRQRANPKFVAALEAQIRKDNPWLRADLSSKDIKEQISELEEMLREAEKREEGKDGS